MAKRALWALVLTAALVSCTENDATPSDPTPGPESDETGAGDPGRLVILDTAGDIIVLEPDGSNRQSITDDAGESAVYTQPIWSPDASSIAWGQADESGFAVGIFETGAEETTTVQTSNLPFYVSWSPDNRSLGVLHNGTGGIDFRMIDVEQASSITVDQDAPFYFSWSPHSDGVVIHAGEDRVETIQPDGDRVRLESTDPDYLAPQWTPNGVFHVSNGEVVVENDAGDRLPVAGVSGLTMFVTNPLGTRVALQATGDDSALSVSLVDLPTVPSGSVVVLDVEGGEFEVVTEQLALGFFWSPDGESLLTLTPSGQGVVPTVWNADGTAAEYIGYQPPATMLQDTFPFFPQYAQSVSFWAPDSSAFAYAGEIDGERGIWVQALDSGTPVMVSDGRWVAWSASSS